MALDDDDIKKLGCAVLGGLFGALLIQNHHDEERKSKAEKDDPEAVRSLCEIVGDVLDRWKPPCYDCEDRYTKHLYRYLLRELDEEISVELRTSTSRGLPDILIDDRLVLELKVNPKKTERHRLIGRCCDYSVEWVTWAIVIDMPDHKVRELRELLEANKPAL